MSLIEFLAAASVALVVGVLVALVLAWLVRLVYQEVCDRRDRKAVDLTDKKPAVVIARSPLVPRGPRHLIDVHARLTPGYEPRHRDNGQRRPAASPIVWADTAVMSAVVDGPETTEFRRITGLDATVPVLRTLRAEGNPRAPWAQQALDLALLDEAVN